MSTVIRKHLKNKIPEIFLYFILNYRVPYIFVLRSTFYELVLLLVNLNSIRI